MVIAVEVHFVAVGLKGTKTLDELRVAEERRAAPSA
jgi:hypothetical protein